MGRRVLNRKEMRADFDAAERRGKEEEERDEDEEEEDDDEDDEEGDGDDGDDGGDDDEEEGEGGDDDEDDEEGGARKKKKKKKPAAPKVKPKAKPRARAAKVTRMRVVWGVFSNSNQCVATYEYPKKDQAVEHAARLTADKRSTHFVQPVKEPMEPKKEKEK